MRRDIIIIVAVIFCAIGGWLLVMRLFPSDQKRLEWTLEDIRKAVESADAQKCMSFVSPGYHYDGMDYKVLEEFAKETLKLSGPMQIRILKQDVKVPQDGVGVVAGICLCSSRPGAQIPFQVRTQWNLMFQKEGKDWKLRQIQLDSVNDQRVDGLMGLLKLVQEAR